MSNDLAGDNSVELTDALFWGFLILILGGAALYLAHRFRPQRWPIWITGVLGCLVFLYLFFGAVSPLLPASF